MTGEIDFTNCKQIPGRAYNGASSLRMTQMLSHSNSTDHSR